MNDGIMASDMGRDGIGSTRDGTGSAAWPTFRRLAL